MIPETSTTLLKDITAADSARWPEFVSRYRPMMVSYLKTHFPAVDADEIVQEALIAFVKADTFRNARKAAKGREKKGR